MTGYEHPGGKGAKMAQDKFYITTAIDYVNQKPHLGTAYEKIGADVMARYKRMCGYDTLFLMGNDEHSTNVEKEARKKGMDPLEYCRSMSKEFREVWKTLNISYDDFIHTTEERHIRSVRKLFARIHQEGYIYRDRYRGCYCESCEEFITEADLEDGLCPRHREKPKIIDEENYFFALSKFEDRLLELIENNPGFIEPKKRENEIVNVIRDGLRDVSISRIGKEWGIPLPIDEEHVIYVWFDALTNYISGLGYGDDDPLYGKYWPADVHVIGKDITRFHCIIWPAMLIAAGEPPPRKVFAHGFISLSGEKMSKTRGNVLDPEELEKLFGAEALRYLLLREVPFDGDGDISIEILKNRYNTELANELGNLLSRTASMIVKYLGGEVPAGSFDDGSELYGEISEGLERYRDYMEKMRFSRALTGFWPVIQRANSYIEENRPWELAREDGSRERLEEIFRQLLAVLICAGTVLTPFLPENMEKMLDILGAGGFSPDQLPPGQIGISGMEKLAPLFPRLQSEEQA
jgi:methionyl-tRNA synthetase